MYYEKQLHKVRSLSWQAVAMTWAEKLWALFQPLPRLQIFGNHGVFSFFVIDTEQKSPSSQQAGLLAPLASAGEDIQEQTCSTGL